MSEFKDIEQKWQGEWDRAKIFQADPDKKKKKFFLTVPYPYVNGAPHLGHAYSFLRGDTYARFKRMQGFNVLFPQGFHATGEPIVGVVERIRNKDQDQISALKALGASDKEINEFGKKGPEFVAQYWMERWTQILKSAGYSVDWRRSFITAVTPTYNKFIQWQYNTLKKKGYVVQGTHPVIWCPHDQSPTGDHDRLVGEGESPVEFTVIKFKLETGDVMPCATMRPETVFGVTNLWMNPESKYVRADVDGESWILSEASVEKVKDQLHKVEVKEPVDVTDLFGKVAKNPITKADAPVLPASFVSPDTATGVVMSVPSHAPFDWAGLHDLKKGHEFTKKYGIHFDLLDSIVPISIIKSEDLADDPAVEIVEKMLITSQTEKEKLDEATTVIYKKEFNKGVLKENTKYSGVRVSEAKDKIAADILKKKIGIKFHDVTNEVVCRCKTKCHVKILENQWFLKFSDGKWKKTVKQAISNMDFYPEIANTQFLNTVDWLKDKACARKSGLGAKLPWDDKWIVETLSDSVIYMAYYTISHIIKENDIQPEDLTDEVFDYVFLGKKTAKKLKVKADVLKKMKEEFDYFYPLDIRLSGKDLIQNHLTYFLFHHTAIWNSPGMWPRSVAANGYVLLKGKKMSKSKGNVTRLKDLIEKYGADVTRLNLVGANENMDDAEWREENIEAFNSRINFIREIVYDLKNAKRGDVQNIDKSLLSRTQRSIEKSTKACESSKFRSAIQFGFFEATNDVKWYIERCGGFNNCNGRVLKEVISDIVKLNAPFMPHIAEEVWNMLGNKEFVSVSSWPKASKKKIDVQSEMGEELVKKIVDDVREIKKISGIKPKTATIIVAPSWKFDVYKKVKKNKSKDFKQILGMMKEKNGDIVKYIQAVQKKAAALPDETVDRQLQFDIIGESKDFIEKQLSVKIEIEDAETSKLPKAKNADVQKPAIMLV